MIYIYDILVNFNTNFFEFFEWEKKDNLIPIKKIPMYKVESVFIQDIITKKIQITDSILLEILGKCEIFDNKKNKNFKYACLFTDNYQVIACLIDEYGNVLKVSDLLLEEATDTIILSKRCNLRSISYNILGTKNTSRFLTRKEMKIKKYLLLEFNNSYKEKNILKLKYLYFEYFDKYPMNLDIDLIYNSLVDTLKNVLDNNHLKLYELLELSNLEDKVV